MDLIAAIADPITLDPLSRKLVPSGIAVELPAYLEAQVRPRSGLAFNKGVTVLNSPGTIDADYRGEIKVLLINLGQEPVTIQPGERIAQLVLAPCIQGNLEEVDVLGSTARGEGGFGSTGSVANEANAQ